MHTTTIRLQNATDVRELVDLISRCGFDVELCSGRSIVDGKSIMGIFSLDFSQPIQLRAYSEHCENFFAAISKFIA